MLLLVSGSVAVVVRFEGPLGGQAQVLGLFLCELGELHPQLVQVGSCHLLVQLWRQNKVLVASNGSSSIWVLTKRLRSADVSRFTETPAPLHVL